MSTWTGFSDSILRFVAERGGGQLAYVERIDEVKKVSKEKVSFESLATIEEGSSSEGLTSSGGTATSSTTSATSTSSTSEDMECDSESSTSYTEGTGTGCRDTEMEDTTAETSEDGHEEETVTRSLVPVSRGGWRTIRVFISSTFLDMEAERDIISTRVFPTLRRWCAISGMRVHLIDVDMRWGITSHDAISGLSLELCLNEVERAKPFFVGLVGSRYGYVPENTKVKTLPHVDAKEGCFDYLDEVPVGQSVTALEMIHGALGPNPAAHSFFYVRNQDAFLPTLPPTMREQFMSEDAVKKVKVEKLKGLIADKAKEGVVKMTQYTVKWNPVASSSSAPSAKVQGLEDFARQLEEDLWEAIVTECPPADLDDGADEDELQLWRTYHDPMTHPHSQRFAGRKEEVSQAHVWAKGHNWGDDPNLLVVVGDEGIGKSAFLAAVARKLESHGHGHHTVISHFAGEAPGSLSVYHVLQRIARELALVAEIPPDTVPTSFQDLVKQFPKIREQAAENGRVIIAIDGVDTLQPPDMALQALPALLPSSTSVSQVKVIATVTNRSLVHGALTARNPQPTLLPLPDLNAEERKMMVRKTLAEYGKKLEENVGKGNLMGTLVRKADARSPTFLSAALSYLMTNVVHADLPNAIKSLPSSLPKLIDFILVDVEAKCGKANTAKMLGMMAASHAVGGVTEYDLRTFTGVPAPVVTHLLSLLHYLMKFDAVSGANGLSSNLVLKTLQKRYLGTRQEEMGIHKRLTTYHLTGQPPTPGALGMRSASTEGIDWFTFSAQRLRSVLYHAFMGQAWDVLEEVLTNLAFIENAASQGLVLDVLSCLTDVATAAKHLANKLQPFKNFVESTAHILSRYPHLTRQEAANYPTKSRPSQAAKATSPFVPWIGWHNKEEDLPLCTRKIEPAPSSAVRALAISKDGKHVAVGSSDWTIKVYIQRDGREKLTLTGHKGAVTGLTFAPSGERLISVGEDAAIFVWSMKDGAVVADFSSARGKHTKPINHVATGRVPDIFATASDDTNVCLWEISSQRNVRTLRYHTAPVTSVRVHGEGQVFASASWDSTIKVYSPFSADARCVATIFTKMRGIRDLCWAPTMVQTIAVANCHGTMRIFDVASKQEMVTVDGHFGRAVSTLCYSPDGKWIASGDQQGCIKVWRGGITGEECLTVTGHHRGVNQVAFAPDNRTLLSASSDGGFCNWDRERTAAQSLHAARVTAVAVSPNGSFAASASRDGTLKILEISNPRRAAYTMLHEAGEGKRPAAVTCLSISGDSKRVITGATDKVVRVWDVACGLGGAHEGHKPVACLLGHMNVVSAVAMLGSAQAFSASWDKSIKKWHIRDEFISEDPKEVSSKMLLTEVRVAHSFEICSMVVSPDGQILATGSFDPDVKLWKTEDLACIRRLTFHNNWVTGLAFHPTDPKYLVSVGYGGDKAVWDLQQQPGLVHSTQPSGSPMRGVGFLTESLVVTVGDDGATVERWSPSGQLEKASTFFGRSPLTSVGHHSDALDGNLNIWSSDVLGNVYWLKFFDTGNTWSAQASRVTALSTKGELPNRREEREEDVGESETERSELSESYTSWTTADTAELYPGRGGMFKRFATVAERRQYLLKCRNEYLDFLRNRKNRRPGAVGTAAREFYEQSVKTAEIIVMMQGLGIS
eukprot:Sspe_Gene.8259::Locus_2820_Transcript_2_2_Confidence_0.600_Length_6861::g.8259::m.8259/K11127/TEP1; telomerase protein component 1